MVEIQPIRVEVERFQEALASSSVNISPSGICFELAESLEQNRAKEQSREALRPSPRAHAALCRQESHQRGKHASYSTDCTTLVTCR